MSANGPESPSGAASSTSGVTSSSSVSSSEVSGALDSTSRSLVHEHHKETSSEGRVVSQEKGGVGRRESEEVRAGVIERIK
eukprot:189566-Amorphochlora_amoeboformis.AAC.1